MKSTINDLDTLCLSTSLLVIVSKMEINNNNTKSGDLIQ